MELDLKYKQLGIDDDKDFVDQRIKLTEKLLQKNYLPYLLQLCKRGVPNGFRCKIWSRILNVKIDVGWLSKLEEHLQKWDMLTDLMIRTDSQDVGNDEKFFVFLEVVEKLMLYFTRDIYIL